jgi:ribosomal protein S18 acetylase RimI-like enzyme
MHIRPYSSPDRDRIRDILVGSQTFTDEEVAVALGVIDDAERCPELADYTIFCAQNDHGDVVGYICYGPIPMTDRCYDLYWICVDRGCKKTGIGTSLIGRMESDLEKNAARHIYIDTSSTPPYDDARSFYERHGYHVVSVSPDFYREGDDKIVYFKKL